MRFNLKDLFWLTLVAALVALCFRQHGIIRELTFAELDRINTELRKSEERFVGGVHSFQALSEEDVSPLSPLDASEVPEWEN